jgi:ADP-heptose:LPS heptosyltransferase
MIFDIFHTYYDKYDQIFSRDPYGGSFLKGKTHIVKDWASLYEIEIEDIHPSFRVNSIREKTLMPAIQKLGRFILLQVTGGQGMKVEEVYNLDNRGRNYHHGQELTSLLKDAFPGHLIIIFSHSNERLEFIGETKINDEKGFPLFETREDFMILAKYCSFFICIDSSLHHIASNNQFNKKGIILWGTTSPNRYGYEKNINIRSEYPYCVEIKPQLIVDKALELDDKIN